MAFYFLITLSIVKTNAQFSIGFEGGASINHLNTNINNRALTKNETQVGYSIGIPFRYRIAKYLSLETAPNLTQKKYSIVRLDPFKGVYHTFTNTYLQLPLIAKLTYGKKKFDYCLNIGAYMAYWALGNVNGSLPNIFTVTDSIINGQIIEKFMLNEYREKYTFNKKIDNRLEFGWVAGIGIVYKLNNYYSLFFEGNYYQALTDQQKKYMINQVPQYNQTLVFSIGGMYSFK